MLINIFKDMAPIEVLCFAEVKIKAYFEIDSFAALQKDEVNYFLQH